MSEMVDDDVMHTVVFFIYLFCICMRYEDVGLEAG